MGSDYPLSASAIKTWKTCPKQYWFSYATELEETKISEGYRPMGSAVHESIENVLQSLQDSGSPGLRSQEMLQAALQEELDSLEYDYPESMEEDVQDCLKAAAKFLTDRPDMDILGVEKDHTFEVPMDNRQQPFRAIMDLVTDEYIIDWKTGSSIRPADEKIQGAVYLAAYVDLYGEMPEEIQFVYLKKGEINRHKRVVDGHERWNKKRNEYWDDMIPYAKSIVQAWETDEFPADPSRDDCHWCDYNMYCADSGYGAEDIDFAQMEFWL